MTKSANWLLPLARALGLAALGIMITGSECGTAVPTASNQVDAWTPVTDMPPGGSDDAGDASSNSSDDEATDDPPPAETGYASILVDGVAHAVGGNFDIYDVAGTTLLMDDLHPEQPVAIDPGTYVLKQSDDASFVFATGVVVQTGRLTTISMGAIEVNLVPGSTLGSFDIYDAAGVNVLSGANDTEVPVAAPTGVYLLTQYFNSTFKYAQNVKVDAGRITALRMGAIALETVSGSVGGNYDLFDSTGTNIFSLANVPNTLITAPAGTYVLKQYFNNAMVLAGNVAVMAGQVTRVRMGALRYNGLLAYDLYQNDHLTTQSCLPGEIQTVPAGTYALYEYFTDHLLADQVQVGEGQLVDVP